MADRVPPRVESDQELPNRPGGCDASSVRKLVGLLAVLALGAGGCRASVSANVNANTNKNQDEFQEPVSSVKGEGQSDFGDNGDLALLGARHDLHLAPGGTPTCKCLAVALGGPEEAAFQWAAVKPAVNPHTQLVIGLSSEGIACEGEPADSMGASYWGYRLSGDDVVVIVEAAKFGRPVMQGAIIPKPVGAGMVYVKPRTKNLPYGAPLNANDTLCKIGNPGPARGNMDTTSDDSGF